MIVVEGPDNSGKSTLVKTLVEGGRPLLKRKRFKPGQEETIGESYLKALIPTDGDRVQHSNGVIDRLLASEIVYGGLFRGGSRVTDGQHLAIINMLIAYRAVVAFCDPGDSVIESTWNDREQLYSDGVKIAASYRKSMDKIFDPIVVMRYDWTRSPKSVRKPIFANESDVKEMEWWSANPYGAGSLAPRVVLVGESPSPRMKTDVPFSNGPAGDFLAWSLREAERLLKTRIVGRYYVTNALKGTERDAALLREELRFLDPKVVVALGREAETMLEHCHSPARLTRGLPHPQFWRRFNYAKKDQYPIMLANALRGLI